MKDLIKCENDDVALCYSDHPERYANPETGKEFEVNHGWFVLFKKEWIAYNLTDEMMLKLKKQIG